MRDNVRQLMNIVAKVQQEETPVVLVFLDVEKAFNRIEWGYPKNVMHRFGKWLKMIYKDQVAIVVMEGYKTRKITISCGVRQGCPLSPLIFNMALEPLAIAIRANKVIKGIQLKKLTIRLGMYVDDVVSNPVVSIKALNRLIGEFGLISAYKVNLDKSVLTGFHIAELMKWANFEILAGKWETEWVRYLGVEICRTNEEMVGRNVMPIINQIQEKM